MERFVFSVDDDTGNKMCVSPINRVTDNIFIGDHNAASNFEILKNHGITHIINCAEEVPNYFGYSSTKGLIEFEYINLNLLDTTDSIIPAASRAYEYIKRESKKKDKARFLVHCHMGRSRSASVVIYYLMRRFGPFYEDALETVKKARPMVNPNESYTSQLEKLKFKG